MLQASHLTVRYGSKTVLRDVSCAIREGEWWMLAGPNGAGKSTLMSAIAQTAAHQGEVRLNGEALEKMPAHLRARQIAVLAQHNQAQYAYTVEEIVRLGRYAHGRSFWHHEDPDGEQLVEQALEATGMTALRGQNILTLSGGELQRAFLAQVFAQNPRVLLLDEPANHLDLPYQQQLFSLLEEWLRTPGRAILSVVHDLSLARRYGTHALLLDHGACAAQGKADDVFTPERLQAVYGMDVTGWMRELLGQWA